ncbi:MAG: hypothetical protein WCJ66_11270 [Verrucomicrobiota bacterium]
MQTYMEQMRQVAAKANAEADERRHLRNQIEKRKLEMELASLSAKPKMVVPKRRSVDTYETQIIEWFSRLPPAARAAPRTMAEFINLLAGRTLGMRAHAPDVSRILSRLGWVRKRIWSADGEGRRVWVPPI